MRPDLPITDRPQGGLVGHEIPAGSKRPYLCNETRVDHRVEAPFDTASEVYPVVRHECDRRNLEWSGVRHGLLQLRERAPRESVHLEGALDPLTICGVDPR